MQTLSILNELANTTKRKEKENILNREKNNEELKQVFNAAYNPDITWWIAKHPTINGQGVTQWSLSNAISLMLLNVASRSLTGNTAIGFYQGLLESLPPDDAEVLRRIIDRDLACGVGEATINKIWKGLIPTYKLMKAESDPKNLVFPCYVQTKYDGLRCIIKRTDNDDFVMLTSNGNQITSLDVMYESLRAVMGLGEIWDGELVCYKDYKPLPRKESNGILNKAIRNTISQEEAHLVTFIAWDIVDESSTIPYHERFNYVSNAIKKPGCYSRKVILADNYIAHSPEQVEKLFTNAIELGLEGVIAKNINSVWVPKRTFDMVKYKSEKTCDLLVVGWEEGEGRNLGRLGALVCESSDGKISVKVGAITDKLRDEFTPNIIIGKIIEVKYNERITKKSGAQDSLFLPRFIRVRYDKTEANSSSEVL